MPVSIVPAPAIIARADTPISECVRRMRDHKVGSLLVIDEGPEGNLIGIFTERDLLLSIDLIQDGGHWSKPIRAIMTKKVKTITPEQIGEAGEIMLGHGFRHLPVVIKDESGRSRIMGMVSVRDSLRGALAKLKEGSANPSGTRPIGPQIPRITCRIGVISRDAEFVQLLKRAYAADPEVLVRRLPSKKLLGPQSGKEARGGGVYRLRALILDLDGWKPDQWSHLIRTINGDPEAPPTFIVFDPMWHPTKIGSLIQALSRTGKFKVYAKPIDLLSFFEKIRGRGQ